MKSNGKGKYDDQLTQALKESGATNGVLIVLDGKQGASFCVQVDNDKVNALPILLENMAQQIREQAKQGQH